MDANEVLNVLKEAGHRLTPQRRRIVEILLDGGEPPTAREIYDRVREEYPNVSLDTVYRNLGLLTDVGLVHQINLKAGERARFEFAGSRDHHHHLICLHCGRFTCMDYCPLADDVTRQAEEEYGFEIVHHAFELYGYCAECRASNHAASESD